MQVKRAVLELIACASLAACHRPSVVARTDEPACRCTAGQGCWPDAAAWQQLAERLTGSLEKPVAVAGVTNPFALQDQSGGTQSVGWLDAWTAAPSAYAVAAETTQDVVEAVSFARRHRLRVVVKGTGHDYLGRSSAPGSLLIWTHRMRAIDIDDAFVARGCPADRPALPAVSVGAGTRWAEVYAAVTPGHGRYVQGGGCTTVGAAGGFTQGGGFGSWSKKFGTGAAGVIEAEVVTADGRIVIANACQNQDLFWALRGGGGGTFGVVTRMTLMTHPLPESFGAVQGRVVASSDDAFRALLERFVEFYRVSLSGEHWGENVTVHGDNALQLSMMFQGMSAERAEAVWQPLRAWIEARPDDYRIDLRFVAIPARMMWDHEALARFPNVIDIDPRDGQPAGQFWWTANDHEVSTYWYAYQSHYLPLALFEPPAAKQLAHALYEGSRHWSVALHFQKGQADASPDAIERGRETSMNPAVFEAAALVIIAANQRPDRANTAEGAEQRAKVAAAMASIRALAPTAGAYPNEADYFEPDWPTTFWGEHYGRLRAIKRTYDPDGMFVCHHCVGSEDWSSDGTCRVQ